MKIIGLKSKNIKRLKAVEIKVDNSKSLVEISGANAQGKSSVLDSIWYALGGKKQIPGKPIREGQEEAEIELKLNGYTIVRTFKGSKTTLTVTRDSGERATNPQEFLNSLISEVAFDPLSFTRMKEKEQVEELARILNVDIKIFQDKIKELTEERLLVGRDIKTLGKYTEQQVADAQKILEEQIKLPSAEEAVSALTRAEQEIAQYNQCQQDIVKIDQEIKELQEKKERLKAVQKPTHNLDELRLNVSSIQEKHQKVVLARSIIEQSKEVQEKQDEYNNYTTKIRKVEADFDEAIKNSQMPLQGLSWDDNGILYNNIPFNQLSSAEQLKVSMAMAMAGNPELKVIIIKDGSLLDSENIKVVEELAKGRDFQVWCEVVDETGQVGFYIEDGEIKNINE